MVYLEFSGESAKNIYGEFKFKSAIEQLLHLELRMFYGEFKVMNAGMANSCPAPERVHSSRVVGALRPTPHQLHAWRMRSNGGDAVISRWMLVVDLQLIMGNDPYTVVIRW